MLYKNKLLDYFLTIWEERRGLPVPGIEIKDTAIQQTSPEVKKKVSVTR